ncbi:MAG: photosynthetic reaction center cytochrome PufC [Janthinobacterium lividum]
MIPSYLKWSAGVGAVVGVAFILAVPKWTHPSAAGIQVGPPPTSMILFPQGQKVEPVSQVAPAPLPAVAASGQLAKAVYKNVQVLGDVDQAEFMRLQEAITQWVAPKQGCGFCHTGEDYASDAKPQKIAARLMLSMTRTINADWSNHIAPSGVTCYTCHRGQPIPAETWFPQPPKPAKLWVAIQQPYNESADTVRKFFPDNGWGLFYVGNENISGQSLSALPDNQVHAVIVVTRIYEMMMQMSDGMGVNCGFCHNSRAFWDWSQSTPQRWTAYYALQQIRELNNNFLLKLAEAIPMKRARVNETTLPVIPAAEAGIQNGNGLAVCATCHYSQPKPMGGADVISTYPSLVGTPMPHPDTTAQAAPAPAVRQEAEAK